MSGDGQKRRAERPKPFRGLSAKLLALIIAFVLLGEVLIFLPSIANFRIQWLKGRVAQAEIAALAAEAAPDRLLSRAMSKDSQPRPSRPSTNHGPSPRHRP